MKKILLVAAAALVTTMSFASVSEAGWRHRHHNGAYLAGGIALGLILSAQPRRHYVEDDYGYERECFTKKRVKYNRWGERVVTIRKICN